MLGGLIVPRGGGDGQGRAGCDRVTVHGAVTSRPHFPRLNSIFFLLSTKTSTSSVNFWTVTVLVSAAFPSTTAVSVSLSFLRACVPSTLYSLPSLFDVMRHLPSLMNSMRQCGASSCPSTFVSSQAPISLDRKSTRLNSSHLGISYA